MLASLVFRDMTPPTAPGKVSSTGDLAIIDVSSLSSMETVVDDLLFLCVRVRVFVRMHVCVRVCVCAYVRVCVCG